MQEAGYRRIKDEEAEPLWRFWFDWSASRCTHGEWSTGTRLGGVQERAGQAPELGR